MDFIHFGLFMCVVCANAPLDYLLLVSQLDQIKYRKYLSVVQCSPLYWAALFDHMESVIALMKASADLQLGENPLKDPSVRKKMKTLIKNLFK